jgi:GT2 family glycosyltransferase
MAQINAIEEGSKQPKVVIIIVNRDGRWDTSECLISLKEMNYSNFNVIIVDNASSDGSVQYFRENFPEVTLVGNIENLGLTGGFNVAIEKALQEGAHYVLCLNNDTIVDKDFIKELVMVGEQINDVGGLCPKEYDYHHPNRIVYAGGKIGLIRSKNYGCGEIDKGQYSEGGETEMLCGAAMMLKRNALLNIGFFDADYFFNWEDKDLAVRLMKNGYKLIFVPEAKLWHKRRGSTGGKLAPLTVYFEIRNHILFAKKNGRRSDSVIVLLYLLFVEVPYFLLRSVHDGNNYIKPVVMALRWHINRNSVPKDARIVELITRKPKVQTR